MSSPRKQEAPIPPNRRLSATFVSPRVAHPAYPLQGAVGELAHLEWGDVDRANVRLRVRIGKTNAARRWVPIPEWLMEEIEVTCPPDDRTSTRRVFPGAGRQTVGNAMRNACKTAGIAN